MTLQTGPYYSNALDQSEKHNLTQNHGPYPDLEPSMAPNAHMYSLADGALQVHQNSTDRHFAGLIQAATAAAGQEASSAEDHNGLGTLRRTTRHSRANISGELLRVLPEFFFLNIYYTKTVIKRHHSLSNSHKATPTMTRRPPYARESVKANTPAFSKSRHPFRPREQPLMNHTPIESEIRCKERRLTTGLQECSPPQHSSVLHQLLARNTPDLPCPSCSRRLS